MAEMNTPEKIRLLIRRRSMILGSIADQTGQTRQNFSNKIKRGDFKESELRQIAEVLGCDLKIVFVDRETGEEF
jgi:hypothetical protein